MFPLLFSTRRRKPVPMRISGLVGWYIASPAYCFSDAGGTVPCGDGDPVQVWKNRFGNLTVPSLTQATSAKRPTLRLISGAWCVVGDGVDDVIGVTGINLPEPFTVSGRFATTTASQTKDVWGGAGTESRLRNETSQLHCYATNSVYTGAALSMPTDGTKVNTTIRFNGASTKLRKDAAADVTATLAPSVTSLTQFYVNNRGDQTLAWAGRHYEYLIYSRLLTDAEVTTLHNYLAGRTP